MNFTRISHALRGTGPFEDGTALIQFSGETDDQFENRKKVAWYVNDLLPACHRFVGFLAKRPPAREIGNPLMAEMADDIDWRGNDIDVFWQGFMVEAKARGSMLLLVDKPPVDSPDRQIPYFAAIFPEDAVVELDVAGNPAGQSWSTDEPPRARRRCRSGTFGCRRVGPSTVSGRRAWRKHGR